MIKTTANIKHYKFETDASLKAFWRQVIGMVDGDGMVHIQVTKAKRKQRSNSQNRYYWGVVIPHINEALRDYGHDLKTDELHCFLKDKFLDRKQINIMGDVHDIDPSTSELSTTEFQIYINRVVMWASQILEIVVPSPESKTTFV